MSLTPEDIEKKRFHDAWRGYNHEEVDLFLDEVAATFVALRRQAGGAAAVGGDGSERVRELEAEVEALRRQAAQPGGGGAERVAELEAQVDTLRRNLAESERNLEQSRRALDEATLEVQAAQAAAAARASASAGEAREARADELRGTESLLRRTLIAAQKAADEAVAEAEQQAAESLAEARRVAAQIESDASARGAAMLAAAQQQIDELEARTHQLRALYAEHHERARSMVEEQRLALERMPAPEEVGALPPRHALPGEGDPGPQGYPEGDPGAPTEGAHLAEGEVVPLVRPDEGLDDSTRIQESVEPAWPLPGQESGAGPAVGESPWSRPGE
ncbi:MAG TPA: DivIVA domain-containing protein, partial [Actinomycetota bacterium]|nr:DivIVA domain-containing protein [Actinomycetota bacterium]